MGLEAFRAGLDELEAVLLEVRQGLAELDRLMGWEVQDG